MGKRREERSTSDDADSLGTELSDYIIIDAVPKTSLDEFAERIFGDITKASACKQLAIGGATGWVTGYLANKFGKMAAISLGSTLLLFQIAQHNGYITIDWTKVRHAMTKAQAKAKHTMLKHQTSIIQKGMNFYEENFFLASGFAAGFLVGFIW
ncbi:unnamed protein product [Candidula unifasciata]|uniref:FUN14 domain-containing protein 1 n=1 Tax=Candidula unifasciata TaxID=100452 RepID=A0A8S3YZR4_9EUPU|nr:unnamed protein product [Candidula unifasciata]